MLAGVIGGIWLLVLGEWQLLFVGIAYMVGGAFLLSIVLLPGMLFAAPAAMAAERGNFLATIFFVVPSVGWTYLVMSFSCVYVFSTAASAIDGPTLPFIFWGYAVALAPWSFLASKDSQAGNDAANVPLFFAQIGSISMMIATLIDSDDVGFDRLLTWFLPFAILALSAQIFIVVVESRSRQ